MQKNTKFKLVSNCHSLRIDLKVHFGTAYILADCRGILCQEVDVL